MSAILTTARPHAEISMSELLSQLTAMSGLVKGNQMQIAATYARLAAGAGKLSPGDFMHLRLFDKNFYNGADVREFAGGKCMRDICLAVNYRYDWFGLLSNKIASTGYLAAFGLPVIPIKAIYMAGARSSGDPPVLPDKETLEDFFLRPEIYPLFGKPAEDQNGLGSIALVSCTPSARELSTGADARVRADDLSGEISTHYPGGYIFQKLAQPHEAIAALSGRRLATVRFLTIAAESGIQIFRACFKIPAGAHMADNYWQHGNLLAQLAMASGRILRATSGTGLDMREETVHPDTKMPLVGFVHPQWEEMKALALAGARLMRNVPLIGWDIACTEKGPVIVEMNEYPDAFLMQFADRRGILDQTFKQFVEFQKRNAAAFNAEMEVRYKNI